MALTYPSPSPSGASVPSSLSSIRAALCKPPADTLHKTSREVLNILNDFHHGKYTGPSWVRFPGLPLYEYEALFTAVDEEFRFRHDYDADAQLLVLRMPESPTHSTIKTYLTILLERTIQKAIAEAAADAVKHGNHNAASDLRALGPLITCHTELELSMRGQRSVKVPDVAFCYGTNRYPSVIVEIGYSQKSLDLAMLARQYIATSNGAIGTVVTVDLEYQDRQGRKGRRPQKRAAESMASAASLCLYRLNDRLMWDEVF